MPRFLTNLVAAALAASLTATAAAAQGSHTVASADGRSVEVRDLSRVVTIGAAVTEIVFALGHGENVVAVDQTSTFPRAVGTKPNVGYMRALSAEGVMSLAPTLILATEGSGPPAVISVLARASIPFVIVPEGYDEAAVLRKVRLIADALGEQEKGAEMTRLIAEDFRALAAFRARIAKPRKAAFVLAVGNGSPTVGGRETSADGMLALAGIENAMKTMAGFKPAVAEATLAAAPDAVITMIERNHGLDADAMFALPAFAGTPAAQDKRMISIPSYFLTFGPRAAHGALKLAASVYPELAPAELPERPWTAGQKADAK
jgi:iron complex transport system substrate-binding protein